MEKYLFVFGIIIVTHIMNMFTHIWRDVCINDDDIFMFSEVYVSQQMKWKEKKFEIVLF